jgi:hypothetical protein
MSRHDPYPFFRLDVDGIKKQIHKNPGVYVARAECRQQVSLAVRYPLCDEGSAILNIGETGESVEQRWFSKDKLSRIQEYLQARAPRQRTKSLDAIHVWHVLDNTEKEKPLYMLFALAVGALPVLQQEKGWKRFHEGETCNCKADQAAFRLLNARDLDVTFQFEHWTTLERIHEMYSMLREHAGGIQVQFQKLGTFKHDGRYGDTDLGTPVVTGVKVLGDPTNTVRAELLRRSTLARILKD